MNSNDRDFLIQMYEIMERPELLQPLGECMQNYFHMHHYKTIAVYGLGKLGSFIMKNLKETDVEVKYIMDQNDKLSFSGTKRIKVQELESVENLDMILVTPMSDYEEIEAEICSVTDIVVISAKELMYDMINLCLGSEKM